MNFGKQHSVLLMPMIEDLMQKTDVTPRDLTHLCVNLGPGSFTGLRIGLSVLEAMSYALNIPLYGYHSFAASAQSLKHSDRNILILHDALKQTFYSAAIQNTPQGQTELLSPEVRDLAELKSHFREGEPLLIAGDGLIKYREAIQSAFPQARLAEDSVIQRASNLARLCKSDVDRQIPPGDTTLPRYMRKPQAQREYEAKHGHVLDS